MEKVLLYYSKSLGGFFVPELAQEAMLRGAKVYYHKDDDIDLGEDLDKAVDDFHKGIIDPRIKRMRSKNDRPNN